MKNFLNIGFVLVLLTPTICMAKQFQVLLLFLLLAASGCNWVDSTGIQENGSAPTVVGETPPELDESQIRALALNENTITKFIPLVYPENVDSVVEIDWAWGAPYQSGALPACEAIAGFDSSFAAPTLQQACADPNNCDIRFEFVHSGEAEIRFDISVPELKAPTGLAYTLSASDATGSNSSEYLTLCAIAINEAPVAVDDYFDIDANVVTEITADSSVHLLSNDFDDTDVRNQPLSVISEVVEAPRLASLFSLLEDGGFVYQPRNDLQYDASGLLEDGFSYAVSDGLHQSIAKVTLRIRRDPDQVNSPPIIYEIADEFIGVGDRFVVEIDAYDADGDTLIFSLGAETPDFVVIDPDTGFMTGISDTPGSYPIVVIADDGQDQFSTQFILYVQTAVNHPPYADNIQNKTVSGKFSYDVSGFFGDRDNDPLTFTASGLPYNAEISASGVISGEAHIENLGTHTIRVFASDGRGGESSDGFRLTIEFAEKR